MAQHKGTRRTQKSTRAQHGRHDGGQLAEALRSWALDEMRFRPQGRHIRTALPTTEDFAVLCRGPLVDVFNFLIRRVHPAQTVQKVKGNLKLQSGQTQRNDAEIDKLKQEYGVVTGQVAGIKTMLMQIEKEIKRLQKDIQAREQVYRCSCKHISDLHKRSAFLVAHSKSCQKEADSYRELAKQIRDRITQQTEIAKKATTEPTYFTCETTVNQMNRSFLQATEGRSTPLGLESACTRSVREATEDICSFLHEICQVDEESGELKRSENRTWKDKLWTQVEQVIWQHPAQVILASLTRTAQESTASLREITQRINLKKDAEDLKFKYENRKLTDTSFPPTLLQSVHQLIEEGQAADFKRFIDSERALNQAWRARQRLATLQQDIDIKLASCYADAPGDLDLARSLCKCEQELVAAEASLLHIQQALQELDGQRTEKQAALQLLNAKHKKIKDFEKVVQTNQTLIQALVKQNSSIKAGLDKQKREILQYIQGKVCSHDAGVKALTDQLHNSALHQVESFAALPLDQLHSASTDTGSAVCDLSIHRLDNLESTDGGTSVSALLNKIDFPSYKAPEELLPKAMEMKEEVEDAQSLLKFKEEMIQGADRHQSANGIVEHLNALSKDVAVQDNVQMEHVMPIVQNGIANTTRALSTCIAVKEAANSWFEQPAQFTVPWVKVGDMNMRQWTDQWTLLATKLRQLQAQR